MRMMALSMSGNGSLTLPEASRNATGRASHDLLRRRLRSTDLELGIPKMVIIDWPVRPRSRSMLGSRGQGRCGVLVGGRSSTSSPAPGLFGVVEKTADHVHGRLLRVAGEITRWRRTRSDRCCTFGDQPCARCCERDSPSDPKGGFGAV